MRISAIAIRVMAVLSTMFVAACPKGPDALQHTGTPQPSSTACVAEQPPPPPELPWKDADELCQKADRGSPWPGASPPLTLQWEPKAEEYAARVQGFLRNLDYRRLPYNWLHDANWRMTGPFEGCPCPDQTTGSCGGINKGPHPAVRVYYSPQVIDWMCQYRKGDNELPDASTMPDGAMIIKEMLNPDGVKLALVPGTDQLWIAPIPGKPPDFYDQNFSSWTVMIKASKASADGWYWAYFDKTSTSNPPLWDRCAFGIKPYPGSDGQPVTSPPGCEWFPTYWNYSLNDVQFPNNEFGNYCVYCHASAQGEDTFSSFVNLLGTEIRYSWTPVPSMASDVEDHERHLSTAVTNKNSDCPSNPFTLPRDKPLASFKQTFPELDPAYQDVWATRLPAQTWDHTVSQLGVKGANPNASQFLTSDQCQGCHEAGGAGQLDLPYMVEKVGDEQVDLSEWAEWSVSPMGLAGRDPVFHAQLELERNIAADQPDLSKIRDCIDNTCLHCHGVAGARQYNIDTAGQGAPSDPCKDFLPPKDQRRATDYDGNLFTHRMAFAWRDEDAGIAKYGGLARDGVNCSICHHIADVDLDQSNLPKTFTGNFRVGPPDKIFGPFPNADSKEEIRPKPMQNALGVTPEQGKQILGSEMCGTCHTVFLPVFNDRGKFAATAYEQTTYLEWLLSDFTTWGQGAQGKSCQDCHMPHEYNQKGIMTGVANVQDTRYPAADFLMSSADVDIPKRPYNRHQLYGLNVFLNAYAQQFPLLLGIRQQDFMNGNVRAPLLTGLESVLDVAYNQTAELRVDGVQWKSDELEASVTVQNLAGHSLPSGVGFRRLFIEVVVLDGQDKPLWASGRTNDIGVIVEGTTDKPLPTEFWNLGPDGLPFQPHHQVITDQNQAQIYEEVTQNSSLEFTSSFIHRYWAIKDNRVRPKGWNPARVTDKKLRDEYGDATRPGTGPEQNWWPKPRVSERYRNSKYPAINRYTDTLGDPSYTLATHQDKGLPGTDSVIYRIRLDPQQRASVKKVRVTLYSQSTPPHYLKERFVFAAKKDAERRAATQLYYMTGHLNTDAKSADGNPYLTGYKLRVGKSVDVGIGNGK